MKTDTRKHYPGDSPIDFSVLDDDEVTGNWWRDSGLAVCRLIRPDYGRPSRRKGRG